MALLLANSAGPLLQHGRGRRGLTVAAIAGHRCLWPGPAGLALQPHRGERRLTIRGRRRGRKHSDLRAPCHMAGLTTSGTRWSNSFHRGRVAHYARHSATWTRAWSSRPGRPMHGPRNREDLSMFTKSKTRGLVAFSAFALVGLAGCDLPPQGAPGAAAPTSGTVDACSVVPVAVVNTVLGINDPGKPQ